MSSSIKPPFVLSPSRMRGKEREGGGGEEKKGGRGENTVSSNSNPKLTPVCAYYHAKPPP